MSSDFFDHLVAARKDSPELIEKMKEAVARLGESKPHHPGMLLGRIQSGKTRAFIGIIARAFDEGFDFAIVLTKGTQALSEQTVRRITQDFKIAIDDDKLRVYDIMRFPKNLRAFHLRQKMVIVAKKESKNLQRIMDALSNHYPDLKAKRLLIVDDEADFATLAFRKSTSTSEIEAGTIANWIDQLRASTTTAAYLQVTATPYSLYLQPDDQEANPLFHPIRPAFTTLLPLFEGYVGGDYFFGDHAEEGPAQYAFREVSPEEIEALKKEDGRRFKLDDILTTPRVSALRGAMLTFMIGGCIRRLQQTAAGKRTCKYAFVVHTDQSKVSHEWQARLVDEIITRLGNAARSFPDQLEKLVREAFNDLLPALATEGPLAPPEFDAVLHAVRKALIDQELMISVVNSENDVKNMLDEDGQLHLDAPLNVFIGGQILDRGITIRNLIGFYYGRNPKSYQQDTVLQHARIYGNRPAEDLPVTRFYTTVQLHSVMKQIHDFDTTLRLDIEKSGGETGVYFLRRDEGGTIKPCSPNKILASNVASIRPNKRIQPVGFQTGYKSYIKDDIAALDALVAEHVPESGAKPNALIPATLARDILTRIAGTLEFEQPYRWDFAVYGSALEYLARQSESREFLDQIHLLVYRNRNLKRYREQEQRFSNDPLSYQDRPFANELSKTAPVLILVRQNGTESDGWRDCPFWWPIIIPPSYTKPIVFASDTASSE